MSSLTPLVDSSSSERARELLRAARADRPRSAAAQRTLAALGVAGAATTVASTALGSAAAPAGSALGWGGAASLPAIAAKWVLLGTLSGLALASGATLVFSNREAAPPQKATHAVVDAPVGGVTSAAVRAAVQAPLPTMPDAEAAAEQPSPEASPSTARRAPAAPSPRPVEAAAVPLTAPSQAAFEAPEQSRLLRDIALLDAARRALKSGSPAQASALVARYESERQTRVLDREAQLLRIDVLMAQGERARAKALAEAYLRAFPNDTHAAHLRSVAALSQ